MAEYFQSDTLNSLSRIRHGFFSRNGGVSTGIYAALNCGYGSDDAHDNVAVNRQKVAQALGMKDAASLITPYQTHSSDVIVVSEPWHPGEAPKADAIITREKGLAIGILTADCGPVLFADEKSGLIAAAHAGWRGALGGILGAVVEKMVVEGAERDNIRAAIGPCLHQPSYEVAEEFKREFITDNPEHTRFFAQIPGRDRPHFDLPAFISHQLTMSGLTNITTSGHCTYENESLFFSYRRNCHQNITDYGRQIAAIVLT